MYDLRPALQLTNHGNGLALYDLLASRYFHIEDPSILPFLAELTDLVPGTLDVLMNGLIENTKIDQAQAHAICESLIDMGLLCLSDVVAAQKCGVQMWVDNGWIDALVLHFASRNLKYVDDPEEFGGDNNLDHINNISSQKRLSQTAEIIGPSIRLVQPSQDVDGHELLSAIMSRRSFKPFRKAGFAPGDLETVLWFGNLYARERAISSASLPEDDRNRVYDSAFSCLSTYVVMYKPIETDTYMIDPGAYFYDVHKHELHPVRSGNLRSDISRIATGQKRAGTGLMSIVLCADWENYGGRYPHERSYRNLLINTAQLAQFYLVLSTMRGFDTFMTPAIQDERMSALVGAGRSMPLYLVTAG